MLPVDTPAQPSTEADDPRLARKLKELPASVVWVTWGVPVAYAAILVVRAIFGRVPGLFVVKFLPILTPWLRSRAILKHLPAYPLALGMRHVARLQFAIAAAAEALSMLPLLLLPIDDALGVVGLIGFVGLVAHVLVAALLHGKLRRASTRR